MAWTGQTLSLQALLDLFPDDQSGPRNLDIRAVIASLAAGAIVAPLSGVTTAPIAQVNASTGTHTISSAEFSGREYIASALTGDATHTTPSAADIIASFTPTAPIGSTFDWAAVNLTSAQLTIGGGTGVTFTGSAVVDASAKTVFLVTIVSASAVTMQRLYSTAVGA
jgi:hypothetical protein